MDQRGPAGGRPGRLPRIADLFLPSWLEGGPHARLMRSGHRVRLVVAASSIGTAWIVPGATQSQRVAFAALVAGVYLPFAVLVLLGARRMDGPAFRLATVLGDVSIVFLFQLVLPPVRLVCLFGLMLLAAMYSYLGGRAAGLMLVGASAGLTVLAQTINPMAPRVEPFTLIVFVTVAASLAVLLDAASSHQRGAARRIELLHDSLRSVSSLVDLPAMLEAVTASARSALGAVFAVVRLGAHGRLLTGAISGLEAPEFSTPLQEAAAADDHSPSAVAMATGETVVVREFEGDPTFGHWAAVATGLGFRSMIVVPLPAEGGPLGVLNVAFADPADVDDTTVELANAFGRQAAVAISRSQAYEREKAAANRLRELDHLKTEFIATVSHELRTPLTSIQGFTDVLLRKWEAIDEERRREFVERVDRNARELHGQIEELLDFSRLDVRKAEVHPEVIALRPLVEGLLEAHAPVVQGHEARLEIPSGLDVQADPYALDRILSNLLANAAKFSPPGSVIEIGAEGRGLEVEVWVRDEGVGIPREDIGRIFEPFFRSSEHSGEFRGTGIGLSVVRRYVELHGGQVWAETDPGATFRFTLPRAYSTRLPEDIPYPSEETSGS